MKDNPEAQAKLERISNSLTEALGRVQNASAELANQKPSRIPPLNKHGKFAPEGTFER